jgi:hypothetical protein
MENRRDRGIWNRRIVATAGGLAAFIILAGLTACAGQGSRIVIKDTVTDKYRRIPTAPGRPLPGPLYGVTVDNVSHAGRIAAALRKLPETPTVRLYFDVREPPRHYAAAVGALRPVSYLMGELLDSSEEMQIGVAAYEKRTKSYLAAFRGQVDLWEIGNEVNGNWTGPYPVVRAKLTEAYRAVTVAGKRTALTLYYNVGCGDGRGELGPLAFSRAYVPRAVRAGLDYVLLSYYPGDCRGTWPGTAGWAAYFRQLHRLYPHARLGFGEIGLDSPVTAKTLGTARSLIRRSYGLAVRLPCYVGGYFWWYFREDALPYPRGPLWRALRSGFLAEARARHRW